MPTPPPGSRSMSATVALSPARLRWIANASLAQLENERRAAERDLGLPNAELWAEQYAEAEADFAALTAEIERRRAPIKHRRAA